MKTPEQMAEEWAAKEGKPWGCERHFLAGYKAAMNSPEKPDTCEHILDMEKMVDVNSSNNSNGWISVKDRLPEIPENDYSNSVLLLRADRFIVIARIEKCVRFVRPLQKAFIVETDNGDPIEEFTHWMPLPAAPKEEK
jgi:hypothetical protein